MIRKTISEIKDRYAICIGINQYHSSARVTNLHYAENDAQAFYDLLLHKGFVKDHCSLFLGEQATLEAIHNALTNFVLTKPHTDDLIIFYFAGHGLSIGLPHYENASEPLNEAFLVTYDFDRDKVEAGRGTWLTYPLRMGRLRSDFFEVTLSKKVLFIFDCCHSGDFYGANYRNGESFAHRYINQAFGGCSAGRIVLSSCMPFQNAREDKQLAHGLFTYHLLHALRGHIPQAIVNDGWITVGSLFDYLSATLPLNQRPVKSGVEHGSFQLLYYPKRIARLATSNQIKEENKQKRSEREIRLRAMLADHNGFMQNRLESFVGRRAELTIIRERIAEKLLTGGYVTITGQAGQGKSSTIAKLVEDYGAENVAFHFIPFNPGPDHQVGLLRNLMSRLILKYQLPEFYAASESRPALRDYFPKVLREIVDQGGKEIIFIDGLDQLEEEQSGLRDLSFLPNNPPPGIVFVLGTRPNDTLRPLELLKPRQEYQLPNLSRNDFDLILRHRKVLLSRQLTDRFYEAMQENALYLDLVAKELTETDEANQSKVIKRVAENPDNIFSLSVERFKRQDKQWRTILKPILGLLLAASEPLAIRRIRQVLEAEDDEIRDGLRRLGGLVAEDGQGRRYLFHLKLRDYLRQDENNLTKDYVFASDEEVYWHKKLVKWCEKENIETIWLDTVNDVEEQERRIYARQHYITHLYRAKQWERLWHILDEGDYGRAKVRYDPSTRSYAQDLDIGRQVAAQKVWPLEEGLSLLPRLWRYTLLRCSLTSRADSYTPEAFDALLLLQREQEALGLAELLTNPTYKVNILRQIAGYLGIQLGRRQECFQLLMRSYELAHAIESEYSKAEVLCLIGAELAEINKWEQAKSAWEQSKQTAKMIKDRKDKVQILSNLVEVLINAHQWELAEIVISDIENSNIRSQLLQSMANMLIKNQHLDRVENVIQAIEEDSLRVEALQDFARVLIAKKEWKRTEFAVNMIEEIWARSIRENLQQELTIELIKSREWKAAEQAVQSIEDKTIRIKLLRELVRSMIRDEEWEQAELVVYTIDKDRAKGTREEIFQELAMALIDAKKLDYAENILTVMDDNSSLIEKIDNKTIILYELVRASLKIQDLKRATHVANMIKKPLEKARALQEICTMLINFEQWKQAKEIIRSINIQEILVDTSINLSEALIKAHLWKQVEAVSGMLEVSQAKAAILQILAIALADSGQAKIAELKHKEANKMWEKAEEEALSSKEVEGIDEELRDLAAMLTRAQQWDRAERIAQKIEMYWIRAPILQEIATALVEAQQWDRAEKVWDEAVDAALMIGQGGETKVVVLETLATALVEAQQWDRAEKVWDEAVDAAQHIDDPGEQIEALPVLASALIEAQQWERAESVIQMIWINEERETALYAFIKALNDAQQWDRAKKIEAEFRVWKTEREIQGIEDENIWNDHNYAKENAVRLQMLAIELMEAQQWDQAAKVWRKWEQAIEMIDDFEEEGEIRRELAQVLVKHQQWDQAEEDLLMIHSTYASNIRERALQDFAISLIENHRWKHTERIVELIKEKQVKVTVLLNLTAELLKTQQDELTEEMWCRIEDITRTIESPYERVKSLQELATALTSANMQKRANIVWTQAEEVAQMTDDKETKARLLQEMSMALANVQRWEQACKIVYTIEDHEMQASALVTLGKVLAKAQQEDYARALWAKILLPTQIIEENDNTAIVQRELSIALIKAGKLKDANIVANTIEDLEFRSQALRKVSVAFAKMHLWEDAEAIARTITEVKEKAEALREIATLLLKAQHRKKSTAILIEAERVTYEIEDSEELCDILISLGTELVNSGQKEHAYPIWSNAEAVAYTIKDKEVKAKTMLKLSSELVKAQQKQYALDILVKTIRIAHQVDIATTRTVILSSLAMIFIKAKYWEQAKDLAYQIDEPWTKARVLREIGAFLAEINEWEQAEDIWAKTEKAAEAIENNLSKSGALRDLGTALAKAKRWEQARKMWAEAEAVINTIKSYRIKAAAQLWLSATLAEMQQWEQVDRLWNEIETLASMIEEPRYKAEILLDLGAELAKVRQWDRAEKSWNEAEAVTHIIDEDEPRVKLLLRLSMEFFKAHQRERASLLWAEAEAVAHTIDERELRIKILVEIADTLEIANEHEQLLHLVHHSWLRADTREYAIKLLPLAFRLLLLRPEIGLSFCKSFAWVDGFLQG